MCAVIDLTELDLAARVDELEELLERERARRAGLEAGIESLTSRLEQLRHENAALRSQRGQSLT